MLTNTDVLKSQEAAILASQKALQAHQLRELSTMSTRLNTLSFHDQVDILSRAIAMNLRLGWDDSPSSINNALFSREGR